MAHKRAKPRQIIGSRKKSDEAMKPLFKLSHTCRQPSNGDHEVGCRLFEDTGLHNGGNLQWSKATLRMTFLDEFQADTLQPTQHVPPPLHQKR